MGMEGGYASSPPRRNDQPLASLLMGMIGETVLSVGAKMEVSVMFNTVKISCVKTSVNGFPVRRSMM